MLDFIGDVFMPFIGRLFLLVVAALIVIGGLDWVVFSRRGFDATAGCQAKRMQSVRKLLSSKVVCIPVPLGERNDTTTVQIKQ